MKTNRNHWNKRVAFMTTTGVLALAPMLVAIPNTWAGPLNAPGKSNNSDKTLTATIMRTLSDDNFEVRDGDGKTLRARVNHYDGPRRPEVGDQVRLTGNFFMGLFVANKLEFLNQPPADNEAPDNDGNPANSSNRTLTGTVTRDLSGNNFQMRTTNGHNYRVKLVGIKEPARLSKGDRVKVRGKLHGKVLTASQLKILKNKP